MTIDESKEWLKLAVPIKALTQEEFATFIQAVNLAVDTMRKYQQIEQILDDWNNQKINNIICCLDIKEVIEDGNDLSSGLAKNSKKLEKDFGELDCISRAEAIKCLECDFDITGKENMKTVVNYINSAHDKIVNLPSVTPQEPRWIPCSEKKPDKGGEYLLWGKICDDDDEEYCFLGDYYEFEEKFGIEKSNYDPHTLGFLDTEIEEYYSVVAWMPLPAPYEPQESEGKE